MKILTRDEFLELPSGTVYYERVEDVLKGPRLKHDTIDDDFSFSNITDVETEHIVVENGMFVEGRNFIIFEWSYDEEFKNFMEKLLG